MINNAKIIEDSTGQRFFGENGAAGCIFLSQKTGRLMLGRRSEDVLESGTWGTWGGAIEEGSNPRRTAFDKMFEETGHEGAIKLEPLHTFTAPDGSFQYHNFVAIVDDEFEPWASHESGGHKWFEAGDWPEPLHFGVYDLISDTRVMEKLNDLVQRARAGEDLLKDAPPPERTLYHCLYREPEGDALRASCEREENGRRDKFLYAATCLTKALAFSFSYHDEGEIICNGGIDGAPEEFAVVCERSKTMNAPRHIRVLAFSGDGFEDVGEGSRQQVSTKDMPFEKTKLVFETTSLNDTMAHGLQIFSTEKTIDELFTEDFFGGDRPHMTQKEWLHSLTKRPDFIWENKARDINPSPFLKREFAVLDAAQSSASVTMKKFYHASPLPVEGEHLMPGTRNIEIMQADSGKTAAVVEYNDQNAPYLYATDNPQLSMTYTVPKGVRMGNMHGHGGTEVLFLGPEEAIGDPDLRGGMYSFESSDFVQIYNGQNATDQWVSNNPVSLKQAEFTPVRSFNDIMRRGVQIYQLADGEDAYAFTQEWDRISAADPSGNAMLKHVQDMVQAGRMRWMNEERGIHPVNALEQNRDSSKPAMNSPVPLQP